MPSSNKTPPLLTIPLELREAIYKELLSNSVNGPQLLRTCREIYEEARKFLYQRPLIFSRRSALQEWLDVTPYDAQLYVADLTIELQDVDLSPLLDQPDNLSKANPTRLQTWKLYDREERKLRELLLKFPNLRALTIRPIQDQQSSLYQEFLRGFLKALGSIFPNLHDLCLEGNFHHQSLSFLVSLVRLQSFTFDGFSSSTPQNTADIFSRLADLTNLSVKTQSFTEHAVRNMGRLSSFSLLEPTSPTNIPSLFFTTKLLAALRDQSAFTSLTLVFSCAPDGQLIQALEGLLRSSSIAYLRLDWPSLDPSIMTQHDLLPSSLKEIWIRTASMEMASNGLQTILARQKAGNASSLRRVVFIRKARDASDKGFASGHLKDGGLQSESSSHGPEEASGDAREVLSMRKMSSGRVDRTVSGESYPVEAAKEETFAGLKRQLEGLHMIVAWHTETAP
ncbi:hypothetical protein EJ04DRAFT_566558 [Polyplosphaeria fusca]|uniref:Uncharacterized protein n=1 Tax=Polyplosphaeria fusca TaxID=682080 RepID=A0A9P4QVM3_9PLEO|nr:hypothetical protein EJ04DRAFT_566558 [Polyplosphaeria fusca]